MLSIFAGNFRSRIGRSSNVLVALAFALSGLMPIILSGKAGAAQLSNRKVTIGSSQEGASTTYRFDFNTTSLAVVQSIKFEFCTTPLGTCTKPNGMVVHTGTAEVNTANDSFSEATDFTEYTGVDAGECDDHNNATANNSTEYCVTRTDTDQETAAAKSISIDTITNPTISSGNNLSVYVRIALYSDATFTASNTVHDGTVAASIVKQLDVTGRVQERLVFCVFAQDDADALPTDCGDTEASESYSVDIGIIDNNGIAISPVNNAPPAQMGNDRFGAAMVNTNASNGLVLSYYATAATSGTDELRAFRVPGATCNNSGTSLVDQCFVSADNTAGEVFAAGTERFGVQVACVNYTQGTTANLGAVGTGNGTAGTFNSIYSDDGSMTDPGDDCENAEGDGVTAGQEQKFAWNDTGTADILLSSTSVVDDEMVKLRYAATANATTPTGTYTVSSTYIATPTF